MKSLLRRIPLSLHARTVFAPPAYKVYRAYQNWRIKQIRKKRQITVLFIIGEASTWKTETLYQAMLAHPRFRPVLGVTESLQVPGSKSILIDYLREKHYDYVDLDQPGNSIARIHPDIKFYYKPYESNYRHGLYFDYNLRSLVCSINYGFSSSGGPVAFRHEIRQYAWREFVENSSMVKEMAAVGKDIRNKAVTGIPLQDFLSQPKETFADPWKGSGGKKRIIYAPHHSFKGCNGNFIEYATFLRFGEFMLRMAEKYADRVQWVFKPHPSLRLRLETEWGKERSAAYYRKWAELPNAQTELGAYNDIFHYSDAMIHDCSSFIVEYQYSGKPVLFLEEESHTKEQMQLSEFGYAAYKAHYHAKTEEEIESFIKQVINGDDPMKSEREAFFEQYLRIPNGKTACQNIIDTILGTRL